MSAHSQKTLDFASLPDNRWPGRLIVGGQTLDDFVAIAEETSPDASWTVRVTNPSPVANHWGSHRMDPHTGKQRAKTLGESVRVALTRGVMADARPGGLLRKQGHGH